MDAAMLPQTWHFFELVGTEAVVFDVVLAVVVIAAVVVVVDDVVVFGVDKVPIVAQG